jgi:hypothetical protein
VSALGKQSKRLLSCVRRLKGEASNITQTLDKPLLQVSGQTGD